MTATQKVLLRRALDVYVVVPGQSHRFHVKVSKSEALRLMTSGEFDAYSDGNDSLYVSVRE